MERTLKKFKSLKRNKSSPEFYEEISLITHLAGLTQEEIITNEIEAASNILHCALKNLYDDHYIIIQNILNEEKPCTLLTEKSSGSEFKVFIKDIWLFRIILINSLKHSNILNNLDNTYYNFLISVINHIIKSVDIVKPLSLHLLRTLLLIVTKRKDILSPTLSRKILNHTNKVASSPLTVFRQYAREISKAVIFFVPNEDSAFLDVSLLPIRGIDMFDIVKRFSKTYIKENQHRIIRKVLSMFLKNVESKDGGALYECFHFYSFDEWKKKIWPPFLEHLKCIDYEGEFFQSLLKYWITSNICAYKNVFYNFLRDEPLDWKLKGYVLLESKRKGCIFDEKIIRRDILNLFYDIETRQLALKLATTYHKKSLWPATYEIDVVMSYIYSNTNRSLEEDETKSLRCFLSQIFIHAHNKLKKSNENFSQYVSVLENVYKYCQACLKTDFFEVGAEITYFLWTIAAGSHKDLLLTYRLEKKDSYSCGENLFYILLKERNMWPFGSHTFRRDLINCFNNNGSSTYLTRLFTKYLDVTALLEMINLKDVINESSSRASLDTEKIIKNYADIVFQNCCCSKENLEFLEEINDFITNLSISQENFYSKEIIFRIVLYLEVITIATRHNRYEVEKLHHVVEKSLCIIDNIIINKNSANLKYKMTKILEAFINKVMICVTENIDVIWKNIDKVRVINHLIFIIQRSNMKRPLSLSVEVLKRFGSKMNENESDRDYKIRFLDDMLKFLYRSASKSDSTIRRSPDSRLVIHAMCISDTNPNKPLLKWVLNYLVKVISDQNAADYAVASTLHSIEILISDNNLQCPTLPFVSDIIIRCIELFARPSWIVRNADLQLTRAIIDRFFGVCLEICNRPKCIEDLFVLFPNLPTYFYKILSSDKLDERAILVFQFFSESQIKERFCKFEFGEASIGNFLKLFMDILQMYPSHYGRMAARSYSALCTPKEIPKEICSIVRFFKTNYRFIRKNIVANFSFLIQQLYEKYKNSFRYFINKNEMNVVNFAINDLLKHLEECDTQLFDFVLFNVKPRSVVLDEFLDNHSGKDFRRRFWLHNNIPRLLVNSNCKEISIILNRLLSENLLNWVQIKILTILVSKFENNDINNDTSNEILEILFEKSVLIDDTDNYLLNCYFKTILVFYRRSHCVDIKNKSIKFNVTGNIYKLMIFVLYFSLQSDQLSTVDKQSFYNIVEKNYMNFTNFNEEMKNDVISTLAYLQKEAPKQFKLKIFKLIFYSSLFASTYLEAYRCIILITGKCYSDILNALKDFLSIQNLTKHLKDKVLVARFFSDIAEYIPEHYQQVEPDGYYSEESDILVPKLFLEKLMNSEIQDM